MKAKQKYLNNIISLADVTCTENKIEANLHPYQYQIW